MDLLEKQLGKHVELKLGLEGGELKLAAEIAIVDIMGPLLDKVKELIPGHFDDALIDAAKEKLAEMAGKPKEEAAAVMQVPAN
jgi:hypothetical protein